MSARVTKISARTRACSRLVYGVRRRQRVTSLVYYYSDDVTKSICITRFYNPLSGILYACIRARFTCRVSFGDGAVEVSSGKKKNSFADYRIYSSWAGRWKLWMSTCERRKQVYNPARIMQTTGKRSADSRITLAPVVVRADGRCRPEEGSERDIENAVPRGV